MTNSDRLRSGLGSPNTMPGMGDNLRDMVESPMMRYLMLNVFNGWAVNEANFRTAWYSPVFNQLVLVQDLTMRGVTLIQRAEGVPLGKGWAVSSMLARGVSLARQSCLALAVGGFSDAFANYRMLFEREMVLRYLEANNQYEDFAKAFYATIYHMAGKGISDVQLRPLYHAKELENSKQIMAYIRNQFFDRQAPKGPGHYWNPPQTDQLAEAFAKGVIGESDGATRKQAVRAYDIGNKCVHPRLRDMLQPEESDISAEELTELILVTLVGLTTFGLSLFDESSRLVIDIERVVLNASGKSRNQADSKS